MARPVSSTPAPGCGTHAPDAAATPRPRLLLLGDSLIDFGDWERRLPHWAVISRGRPGERAAGLLHRLPSVSREPAPAAIVLMTGTNDLLCGDLTFPETVEQIIGGLGQRFPSSAILLTSLLPYRVPGPAQAVRRINGEFRTIADRTGSCYVDLYRALAEARDPMFEDDGVHLREAAYRLWAGLLTARLGGRCEAGPP